MRSKRCLPALFITVLVAFSGAGCAAVRSGGGPDAIPVLPRVGNLEKTTLNVAVLPAIDSAGFFVALHDGLFAQEGLTVRYSPAFGDSVIGPQVKGQYDITGNNYVTLRARGFSATAIDLPTTPVSFPAVPDLLNKHVSVAILSEPFVTQMEAQHGAVPVADMDQGATRDFPVEGYAVTRAWARANPNTLRAFQIALRAGQQIADTSRGQVEQAFDSLPKNDPAYVDPQTAALISLDSYPLVIDQSRLQRVADVMLEFGFLTRRFSVSQMLAPAGG